MPLSVGTTLGPYQVTAKIGEGGMGEVYRARDTKLDRDVALKVLPQAFTEDPDRLARFEREAKVLASLNHPGIAGIYGLEESGDTRALVLELVEGPTLADRIAKGPISLDEALPIAKQIAEALEAAHEAGVIHRDLKPANIKIKDDGTVKVLDFGLAKALDPTPEGDPSQSPTLTEAATQMGVIMGTAAYMSPEQARGKPVDKRTDIWAFGAVLYEMLTGTKPFPGNDVSQTLACVIDRDPDWALLPRSLPVGLAAYVRCCLEKDARQRVRDIGDVRLVMEGTLDPWKSDIEHLGAPKNHQQKAVFLAVGVVVGIAVTAAWFAATPVAGPPVATSEFGINFPPTFRLLPSTSYPVDITPDGRHVVYCGLSRQLDSAQIYRRPLDQLDAVPLLSGRSGDVNGVFVSPDNEWVGFFDVADSAFKRVRLAGGPVATVADVDTGLSRGAAWSRDGTFVFATNRVAGLMWVPEAGGVPQALTEPEGDEIHILPHALPGRDVVLFTARRSGMPDRIGAVDVRSGQVRMLVDGTGARFASSGHLVFGREGAVWAVGFDPDSLEVLGEEGPVLEGVRVLSGRPQLGLSDNGTLVYVAHRPQARTLVWVDSEGREEPLPGIPADAYTQVRVSPEGTQLVVGGTGDLWIYDIRRQTFEPLTSGPADDRLPLWSPDGQRILFDSDRGGPRELFSVSADGTGSVERLLSQDANTTALYPTGWSPDGSTVFLTQTPGDVAALDVETGDVRVVVDSELPTFFGTLSPDGQWLAYVSPGPTGFEVYVQHYPIPERRQQISLGGGWAPRWSPTSTELFFANSDGDLMSVVADGDRWSAPEPVTVGTYLPQEGLMNSYDLAPDGRFVVIKPLEASDDADGAQLPDLVVVQNWHEELKRLVPVD